MPESNTSCYCTALADVVAVAVQTRGAQLAAEPSGARSAQPDNEMGIRLPPPPTTTTGAGKGGGGARPTGVRLASRCSAPHVRSSVRRLDSLQWTGVTDTQQTLLESLQRVQLENAVVQMEQATLQLDSRRGDWSHCVDRRSSLAAQSTNQLRIQTGTKHLGRVPVPLSSTTPGARQLHVSCTSGWSKHPSPSQTAVDKV